MAKNTGATKTKDSGITKLVRNGTVSYRVRIDLPAPDGTRARRSRTVATKREAEAVLKAWRLEEATTGLTVKSGVTVGVIAGQWLELARPRLRPKTAAGYAASVRLIEESLGAVKVQDITAMQVQQQYRAWTDAGVGARSIELAHLRLRQILDLAVRWKLVRENVAAACRPPKPKQRERRTWTEEEARKFLQATEGQRFHLLWLVMLTTGLRRGEALGLAWNDLVDLEDEVPILRVRQTVQVVNGEIRIGDCKTKAGERSIEIVSEVARLLAAERVLARDRKKFLPPTDPAFDFVFCSHDGKPLWPDNVYRQFQLDIARADVPRIGLHDVRRTFATIASARGVPIAELAAILGHARPSVTLDVYAQSTRAGGRDAVARVGRALFG